MSFLSPERLWLLGLPGLLLVAYLLFLLRRSRFAVRFTNLELLDRVAPDRAGWRRHLTAALMLVALASLVVALARPTVEREVPRELATVVLAMDTSLSMEAVDVTPSRIAAAQAAALRFLGGVPDQIRVALIDFAGDAKALVPPTTDRALLARAVAQLDLREGTAIGEAIFLALDVLALEDRAIPAAVIVLSDGETTMGRPDAQAAAAAVAEGVPVSTVAFGTDRGAVVVEGTEIPVPVNAGALRAVAEETGGAFFSADTADELGRVFDVLGSEIGFVLEDREVTEWFVAGALLAAVLAAIGSLAWFSRLA